MVESFPEDILIVILSRLPVKSLMRFKCVGKRWRSLISDPGFAKSHLQRLKAGYLVPSQRIIKRSPLVTIDYEALDGRDDRGAVEFHCPHNDYSLWKYSDIVGSCDGLVCLHFWGNFLIYNPATRGYRKLPRSDFVMETYLFHGFGYDSRSDDYKLVEGFVDYDNWELEIFSLKSGSWRSIQVPFQEESHFKVRGPGVYWNGAVHWFVDYRVAHRRLGVIMSFDLSEEKFHRELPLPEVDVDIVLVGIGIHGASLVIYNCGDDVRIEAWIMDEHRRGGGSWTKWFSVDYIPCHFPLLNAPIDLVKAPIAYTRSGKIVLWMNIDLMDTTDLEVRDMQRLCMMEAEYLMVLLNPEDHSWMDYPITGGV